MQEAGTAIEPQMITTDDAPPAIGPYSQAVSCPGARAFLFVSGQLPIPSRTAGMDEAADDLDHQFRAALENALAVVRAGGGTLRDVVKATVFLTDLSQYDRFNRVYSELFDEWRPARSVVQVAGLPKGAPIEVELIAAVSGQGPRARDDQPGGDGPVPSVEGRRGKRGPGRES